MVVSSAKSINSSTFEVFVISFTYSIKSEEPKMDPCGTPYTISFCFDSHELNET